MKNHSGTKLRLTSSRMFAIWLACGSILFAGGIGAGLAMGGDAIGRSVAGAMSLLPLLLGVLFWKRERLFLFLSLYCVGVALMSLVYVLLLAVPRLIPEIAQQMSQENQRWMRSTTLQWLPPLGFCMFMVLVAGGLRFIDIRETDVLLEEVDPSEGDELDNGTPEQALSWIDEEASKEQPKGGWKDRRKKVSSGDG